MISILLAALLYCGGLSAWAASLSFEAIQNSPVIEGCTCEFQRPNASVRGVTDLVFVSAVDWQQATVRLDDNVALTAVSAPGNVPLHRGGKARVRFVGPDDLQVELDLTVDDVCGPLRPCDTIGLRGTMSAVRGNEMATTAVVGGCGC